MWWRVLLVGGLFAGLLSACAVVDPVNSRFDTVTRSLARARDEAIFLNLIRASHSYPLAFATIANVTPTMTNTTSLGLPSFLEGPGASGFLVKGAVTTATTFPASSPFRDFIFGNTTASNATAIGTNFNVSSQETGSFYKGFLKPIDLTILDYFIRQGYSRELLFWLFTESFEYQLPGRAPLGFHYNPPSDLGCDPADKKHRCFIDWVHLATFSGLTVEEKTQQRPSSSGGGGKGGGGETQPLTPMRGFVLTPYWQTRRRHLRRNSARLPRKMSTSRKPRFFAARSPAARRPGIRRPPPRTRNRTSCLSRSKTAPSSSKSSRVPPTACSIFWAG